MSSILLSMMEEEAKTMFYADLSQISREEVSYYDDLNHAAEKICEVYQKNLREYTEKLARNHRNN